LSPCEGRNPPYGFNFAAGFFIPKRDTGLAKDTRPIAVPNSDNRILARIVLQIIIPIINPILDPNQTCLAKGKKIQSNINHILSSYYAALSKNKQLYILTTDFTKAFDSIPHAWIYAIMAKIKLPPQLINIVKGLLSEIANIPMVPGPTGILIHVYRGVKQGCPLSPLLFILAIDPLLTALNEFDFRAYCDDVALALRSLHSIALAIAVFNRFKPATLLELNLEKCKIIPTQCPNSQERLLRQNLLADGLQFAPKGIYLGVPFGHSLTVVDIFKPAITKLAKRVHAYLPSKTSFNLQRRVIIANCFLIPLFSYLMTIYIIPHSQVTRINSLLATFIVPAHFYTIDHLFRPPHLLGLSTPSTPSISATLQSSYPTPITQSQTQSPTSTPSIHRPKSTTQSGKPIPSGPDGKASL
jgi:hypothetical protein